MNELYKVKIKGVSGDINFNSTGDRFPIQMSLFKVENSKSEEILTQ